MLADDPMILLHPGCEFVDLCATLWRAALLASSTSLTMMIRNGFWVEPSSDQRIYNVAKPSWISLGQSMRPPQNVLDVPPE